MAEEQDKTHRLLFQFPRMIQDLIRLCLGGDWMDRLDFNTLERVPERLLSRELVRREQDVLWRLKYFPDVKTQRAMQPRPDGPRIYLANADVEVLEPEEDYFYIYIHLEHQSRPRVRMALDMVTYKLLAIQDLTRRGFQIGDKLPSIFGVVFYNGEVPWNAPTSLLEMLRTVEGAPEEPDFWSYKLIDTQRLSLEAFVGTDSPLVGLFQLEQLENLGDLSVIAAEIRSTLGPEEDSLADAFVTFINEVILVKLKRDSEQPIRIENLEEVDHVVSQRIERITQGWRSEGEQIGIRKGERIGIRKGERIGIRKGERIGIRKGELAVLCRLLEQKFGELAPEAVERLERADVDLLLVWSDRVLTAATLGDVFGD